MKIEIKDLYQLLIAECRYGYTRNNHLMPDGAYEHAKKYLPLMLKEDKEYALNTAKQLCEECIGDQLVQFSDGIDDENGSRQGAFEFIEWLIKFVGDDWKPWNYDNYLRNKALDDEPLYNIYEDDYSPLQESVKEEGVPSGWAINKEKLSKNTVVDYLFREILKVTNITYRRWNVDKYTTKYVFDDLKRVFYIRREI